jgi:membrane associated rhomboid family serine protease
MLLPLKDINPTRHTPWVTMGLVGANVLVFLVQLGIGLQRSVIMGGFVPSLLFGSEPQAWRLPDGVAAPALAPVATLFSSMFMHGGFLHLGGNMLYLWIFGNNVEDRLGHLNFLAFYLLGGLAATMSHALIHPGSELPLVGASGAVAAVLGAYWRLYPRARVRCLVFLFFFVTFLELPAALVLGLWILIQFISGVLGLGVGSGGVAWFAHIGGFLAGIVLLMIMGVKRGPRQPRVRFHRM